MSLVRSFQLIVVILFSITAANAQLAYVTFLHNSPDVGLKIIDLYITQQGVTTFVDNVQIDDLKTNVWAVVKKRHIR